MSLLQNIARRIRHLGPISIAEFTQEVIAHPLHGYYPQAARIGHKGDFITAPELTPVFGEIVTAWTLLHWQRCNYGSTINYTELGPGTGSLIKDVLETVGIIGPAFFGQTPNVSANLVEISERFIAEQENKLCGSASDNLIKPETIFKNQNYLSRPSLYNSNVNWFSLLEYVPPQQSVYICNEFFDALPVQQFELTEQGWNEILVDVNEEDKLSLVRYKTPSADQLSVQDYYMGKAVGTQIEISRNSGRIVRDIATRIAESGGVALIIDYGEKESTDLTFRAFKDHQQVDPFEDLGLCDLTADVDFGFLQREAETIDGIQAYGPITQSSFLTLMGIGERFKQLYSIVPEEQQEKVIAAHDFLCSPDEMGDRFKVMCICRKEDPVPLCFES